jgi:hypothetical protein
MNLSRTTPDHPFAWRTQDKRLPMSRELRDTDSSPMNVAVPTHDHLAYEVNRFTVTPQREAHGIDPVLPVQHDASCLGHSERRQRQSTQG